MTHDYVHDLVSRAAERFPGHVAIAGPGEDVTYAELEAQSNNLANFLLASGVVKGTLVGILAQNPARTITAMLGVLKAGGVFVPLDPELPRERLKAMLSEAAPPWFVVEAECLATLEQIAAEGSAPFNVALVGGPLPPDDADRRLAVSDPTRDWRPTRPDVSAGPDDMCYLYFTSGSTGRPKAIAGRLKAIDHFVRWEVETFGVTEGTRISQLITPGFDAFLRDAFVPLCAGGVVCVPPGRAAALAGDTLIDWLNDQRIYLIHSVPSLFRAILNEDLRPGDFAALKYLLLAGEPLLPSDVTRWTDVYGDRAQLVNLYGPSETTMVKCYYFVQPADREQRAIPVGKPMPGARVLVIDERGKACPPGVVGEIYIRTPFRSLGYYNRPDLTQEVFVPNPLNNDPDDVVYKTGDLGRILRDGNLEFLGRRDHQVKIGGVRVELGEIENVLRRYPAVQDVAVKDWEDAQHEKFLCAYFVADHDPGGQVLRTFLLQYLPAGMLPSFFLRLEKLPRLLNGKVDRKALPNPNEQLRVTTPYVAPRNGTEERLARIWQDVLQRDRVGIHDNFFEVGGHSLRGTQTLSRIHREFQVELPLQTLFERPTVASLAGAILEQRAEQVDGELLAQLLAEIQQTGPAARDGETPEAGAGERLE